VSVQGRWITFRLTTITPSRKTSVWEVVTQDGGVVIGHVSWWGAWRKYSFFPAPNTLYEPTCLRDIARFCDDETRKHMAKNRAEREAATTS
jgi:hypothetical protein